MLPCINSYTIQSFSFGFRSYSALSSKQIEENARVNDERKFWNKFAARYDKFMDRRVRSYNQLLEKLLQEIEFGSTVLEVASGTGVVSLLVAEKAKLVYAVDVSPAMVNQAQKKAKAYTLENIVFSIADAYLLPFENDAFDVAICSNALHNMINPRIPLLEMDRVLKAQGKLLPPTFCHGEGMKSRLISRIMSLTGFPAYHRFTIQEFMNLIERSGFVIEKKEIIEDAIPMAFIVGKKAMVKES
jgi:phosphatidylethanolamine/phosphatidyl-N-methylethanolamine N-methyltransferase